MQVLEKLPTEEVLIETLEKDAFDRNKDILCFYNLLDVQEGACAISIDGKWGSGKTFFIKHTQMAINAINPSSNYDANTRRRVRNSIPFPKNEDLELIGSQIAVYYDAWKNDNDIDPVMSIIYEIVNQLDTYYDFKNLDFCKLAASVIDCVKHTSITDILDSLRSDNPYTQLEKQKKIEEDIREFFSYIINERGNRLVIFIDELDRCRPDFAVKLLEQVKHYISDERITFVFAINASELQHTIKKYYGDEFDSCRYLDRFFNIRVSLPAVDYTKYYEILGLNTTYSIDNVCKRVLEVLNMEFREICRFYQQVAVAVHSPLRTESRKYSFTFPEEKARHFILMYIVPLLIGLKMTDIDLYNEFITGKNSEPLHRFFDSDSTSRWGLSNLLAYNEVFEEKEGMTLVSKKSIIEKLYDSLFINKYEAGIYEIRMGECEFIKSSREFAINSASLLSGYAKFE